jgi:flagellar protein FliO/FliZ
MFVKILCCWFLFLQCSVGFASPVADVSKQPARTVASSDIVQWSLGLVVVLGVFFLCIWSVRKFSGFNNASGADKMRVVGGLSLGMREKVILLQVGKKQLVLGVTPGRIQTLHVLEGEDCLTRGDMTAGTIRGTFAQELLHAIKPRPDA